MRRQLKSASLGLMALAAGLLAAPAQAQPEVGSEAEVLEEATLSPEVVEARAFFERGRALATEERWSEAVEAFERSYELVPRPGTEFNLGLSLYALDRYVEVVDVFTRYLATVDRADEAEASSIADADRLLGRARRRVVRLVLEVAPADAAVTIDGEPTEVGATRERALNPGTHVVRAEAPGFEGRLLEVETGRGQLVRRAIALESTARPALLTLHIAPAEAVLEVDGAVMASVENLELAPGSHRVSVQLEGHEPLLREIELAEGERLALDLRLPPAQRAWYRSTVLWTVVGVVAAGALGVGLGVGLSGDSGHGSSGGGGSGGSTGVVLSTLRGGR